jgi:DNA-binding transcriptional ArsR family regulator
MVAQSFINRAALVGHPEAVEAARRSLPGPEELERLGDFFKTIGDPTRLAILHAIGRGELCVCDLGATLRLSESAISHQLALLRRSRLVTARREGRIVYYRLIDRHAWQIIDSARVHLQERE